MAGMLVVVAHPDDETFGTGSLIAHATSRGVVTTVACATLGEAGSPTPGSVPPGTSLAEVRERELRAAAALLGVDHVELYGWRDSDMTGEPGPGTLCAADPGDVATQVRATIERREPEIVVTLDGSDGHRDHVAVRDATLAAVDQADWSVGRVYLHCLPRALMRRWAEEVRARDPDAPYLAIRELGTPEDAITTILDTSDVRDQRDRAIALHASQSPPYDVMPADLRDAFLDREAMVRVHPPWDGGPVERSVFG